MNDLRGEKDISVAIVASAIAEASLQKLITQKFKTKRAELIGQIFKSSGPLADFHSKIRYYGANATRNSSRSSPAFGT